METAAPGDTTPDKPGPDKPGYDLLLHVDALFEALEHRHGYPYASAVQMLSRRHPEIDREGHLADALALLADDERSEQDARKLIDRHAAMFTSAARLDKITRRDDLAEARAVAEHDGKPGDGEAAAQAAALVILACEQALDAGEAAHAMIGLLRPDHIVPDRAEVARTMVDSLTDCYRLS